jgi:predicted transcriptional regulator
MPVTNILLHDEFEKPLSDLAEKQQKTKNWIINQAIKEYLHKQGQEEQRWQETLIAMDFVKNGKSIAAERVHEWLSSWGTEREKQAPTE